jgi:hypothetical protein
MVHSEFAYLYLLIYVLIAIIFNVLFVLTGLYTNWACRQYVETSKVAPVN